MEGLSGKTEADEAYGNRFCIVEGRHAVSEYTSRELFVEELWLRVGHASGSGFSRRGAASDAYHAEHFHFG